VLVWRVFNLDRRSKRHRERLEIRMLEVVQVVVVDEVSAKASGGGGGLHIRR